MSKRAGEDMMRAMRPQFDARGVSFTVVSGDMIDGTVIDRLLHRATPPRSPHIENTVFCPTVKEFAAAIVAAATGLGSTQDTIRPRLPHGG